MARKISQLNEASSVSEQHYLPALVDTDTSKTNEKVSAKFWAAPPINKKLAADKITNVCIKHAKGDTLAGSSSTSTFSMLTTAPCQAFTHVRAVFKGLEASSYNFEGVLFALTANNTNKVEPTVGNTITNDPTTGWVEVTMGGSTTITVPARVSTTQSSYGYSDWMAMPSMDPDNGNPYPYLLHRSRITAGTASYSYVGTDANDDEQLDYYEGKFGHVNGVSSPASMTESSGTFGDTGACHIAALEFVSTAGVVRILSLGDSIMSGQGGSHNDYTLGMPTIAIKSLLDENAPLSLIHHGMPSIGTDVYAAVGKTAIDEFNPAIALYSVYSPNDNSGSLTQVVAGR